MSLLTQGRKIARQYKLKLEEETLGKALLSHILGSRCLLKFKKAETQVATDT